MSVNKGFKKYIVSLILLVIFPLLFAGEVRIEYEFFIADVQKVIFVVDGDTVMLENGESVRYLGIDAPETSHPTQGLECFGPEATERNRELVEGKYVRLEMDKTNRDRYGRLLRYVYVNDVFINAVLVEEGYAYSYYYPPDVKHYSELLNLELSAEEDTRGLWSACK